MQAVILAAGMGKRLKALTQNNTKCMIKVNGKTLIERTLEILDKKRLSRIVLVVGYEAQKLIDYCATLEIRTPIVYVENPVYDRTNNIYSMALAEEYLKAEDTLILESDLIFEEEIIDLLIRDPRETLALVDKFESWMDGTCMLLDEEDCICDFISGKHLKFSEKENYYKTVNIYKFSRHFSRTTYVPFLEAYKAAMGDNEYYESVIKLIAMLGTKEIRAKRLTGQTWYEIDDIQDLNIAESLFAESTEKKYDMIAKRYGGYWRYLKLKDYCYLVNPYYPPEKMIEEIRANAGTLLTGYPSGMKINSLLAGRMFGVEESHIVAGNGAAELIELLLRVLPGKVGYIRPTFEEYPNRLEEDRRVEMRVENDDFSYTEEDVMEYFGKHHADTIVLINPDNPSGNYIVRAGVEKLMGWCSDRGINLILDESFVDFAGGDEITDKESNAKPEDLTMISEKIFARYGKRIYIIKSISKSYGVPGARLGVLAGGDEETIRVIKEKLPIWNINSFGEFYMQIAEKYSKDYRTALKKLGAERERLSEELRRLPFLRVIPSRANYLMCEITNGYTGRELACRLLETDIFVKDLTPKIGNGRQYLRIAVRRREENEYLVCCLKKLFVTASEESC